MLTRPCGTAFTAVVAAAFVTAPARADVITPTAYAMPNGNGQATGGQFNYWDLNYTGSGSTTTDGDPLSGGLGDLTDGVVAPDNWFNVENAAGTGPYVGWLGIDPVLTFSFAAPATFTQVRVHFDDSDGTGGVSLPASVRINDGTTDFDFPVTDPGTSNPIWVDFTLPGVTTDELTLTFFRGNAWVFASEVEFIGTQAVPAPAGVVLALAGLGLLGCVRRLRGA